ncbi:MAG: Rieske 2Fe-2S domain-containing protein [Acidobacteria bacterium]|nr:Rieske 2Fe-2S domain-containing protein [Acidobacteriota bacterium]MBI3654908.1 Rieske 2Fe-2S domain-containing protein [Acidobacteriota bacterium]
MEMEKELNELPVLQTGDLICQTSELPASKSLRFVLISPYGPRGAFLLHYQGHFRAYLNKCLHLPVTLDYDTGDFFTGDGCQLLCQTHGALYDPLTGYCNAGPPIGLSLVPVKISVRQGSVYLEQRPEDFPSGTFD